MKQMISRLVVGAVLALGLMSVATAQSQIMRAEVSPGVYTNVNVDAGGKLILSTASNINGSVIVTNNVPVTGAFFQATQPVTVSNVVSVVTGSVLVPQATIMPYQAYTNAQATADLTNSTNKGLQFNCNVGTIPLTQSLNIAILGRDIATSVYYTVAAGSYTAAGFIRTEIYPGFTNVAASATGVVVNDFLPDTYRLVVTPSAAGSYVYGCSLTLLK